MAIPNPKVTMFFTSGTTGWDESHIYMSAVPIDDIGLYSDMVALMTARSKCLDGVYAKLTDCRASLEDVNRDSLHVRFADIPVPTPTGYPGGPQITPTGDWDWQSPHLSWPILMETAKTTINPIQYIAGMAGSRWGTGPGPRDVTTGHEIPALYLNTYGIYLSSSGTWGALANRTWPADTIVPGNSIALNVPPVWAAGAGGGPNTFAIVLAAPLGTATKPGDFIRIAGLSWLHHYNRQRYNGTYTVLVGGTTAMTLAAPRVKFDPSFTTNGYLQVATQTPDAYVDYTLRNLTHRKRGRPTYAPRGRR